MAINIHLFSVLWLPWLLLLLITCVSATPIIIPTLGIRNLIGPRATASSSFPSQDFKTYLHTQTLDHFNYRPECYTTFQQRYVINFNAPVFVYLGGQSPLDFYLPDIGFLTDNAPHFKALLHRYYGKSIPFKSRVEAFQNASSLGYLSSSQSLADYAEIILDIKKNLSATSCMPCGHIGALASSFPILYFDEITPQDGFFSIVTQDFRPNGLSILSKRFNICVPLTSSSELKDYLIAAYVVAAESDSPPSNLVTLVCNSIDRTSPKTGIIGKVIAGIVALIGNTSWFNPNDYFPVEIVEALLWLKCSELVMPIGMSGNATMFQTAPFDLNIYIESCKKIFGVSRRPHWITTQFGGHDIKLVVKRFASNIIFSNGLRDPYSVGGVLQNISDSLVALTTKNGSHSLDIFPALPTDPDWLVMQRRSEITIIDQWIAQYYADRRAGNS
uniref:Lysosomal Pro-X carboxypeptidase-like n=1 Tax=Nelumbo nucifera TaxID=4432 RepID=A0A822Y7X0_NELNU|nr:TPA_asm: hypothetical protein HUJ06_028593 [Nelumbo nucifera]